MLHKTIAPCISLAKFTTWKVGGPAQWIAEIVATFGLIMSIFGSIRFRASAVPYAVGLYISAAYWFTSSTSFANPAIWFATARDPPANRSLESYFTAR